MKRSFLQRVALAWLAAAIPGHAAAPTNASAPPKPPRLCWFIPDGMRADPDVFNIFQWAKEGKLPNLRAMMSRGSYGYVKPVFPSHTPANFATLFTGAYPEVHGINDGPMHVEGRPLGQVSAPGFSSVSKTAEPIWVTLERLRNWDIALLSLPGSTPPELKRGITIRGRWGGWGADFHAVNFQDLEGRLSGNDAKTAPGDPRGTAAWERQRDADARSAAGSWVDLDPSAARLFYQGPWLTQQVRKQPASGWTPAEPSFSPPLEVALNAWGGTLNALLCDRTDNQRTDYDTMLLSADKSRILATVRSGAWSDWLPITLKWQLPGRAMDLPTSVKVKLIKLDPNGVFRIRLLYNNLNRHLTAPDYVADELLDGVGPMVDFVDNFPPQLVYYPEDKQTFLEEAEFSLDWHRRAAAFILRRYQPEIFIQDTYTPNQMLTSRWWMGYVDPASARYREVSSAERARLWQEVQWMYRKLDDILGELLAQAGPQTFVVLSSDHGAVPLDAEVRLNNLFAKAGLLKFSIDPQTRQRVIDWPHTRAVFLKMQHVYVHPDGLAGDWRRASGPAYEALRQQVTTLLQGLRDAHGTRPLVKICTWENAPRTFHLQSARCGDLVLANAPGYGWSETMTEDLEVFATPLETGYKQAMLPDRIRGLWTPFVIVGPGIKPGHFLGRKAFSMVDEYPTLLRCLGVEAPSWVQGNVIREIFQ